MILGSCGHAVEQFSGDAIITTLMSSATAILARPPGYQVTVEDSLDGNSMVLSNASFGAWPAFG
ncbi:MAG: hypothetical protein P8J33_09885 [Pirellulaceae bacterium]|nr:hypothetical protein [Pirellulaceae bacterium]